MGGISESRWARIIYSKEGLSRFLGHLDTVRTVLRTLRRVDWPLVYSEGFTPRVKASFSPALPIGFFSETEFIDLLLPSSATEGKIRERSGFLKIALPCGLRLNRVELIPAFLRKKKIRAIEYWVSTGKMEREGNVNIPCGEMEDQRGRRFNLKEWVAEAERRGNILRLVIKMEEGVSPSPVKIVEFMMRKEQEEGRQTFLRKRFIFESIGT